MARGRLISTEIWKSEKIVKFDPLYRLQWIGLITTADDQGRGRAHPGLVRSAIFPLEDITYDTIEIGMQTFADAGLIILYEMDGKQLYQIANWWEDGHQGKMRWAWPSKHPAPEGWTDRLCYRKGNRVIKENWEECADDAEEEDDCPPDNSGPTVEPPPDDSDPTGTPAPHGNGNDENNDKLKNPESGGPPSTPTKKPRKRTSKPKEPSPAKQASQEMFSALAELCQIDWHGCIEPQRKQLNQSEKLLRTRLNASPADLTEFPDWWYAYDWRGRGSKDRPPSPPRPHQVRETWGQFVTWRKNGKKAPHEHNAPSPAPPPDPARVERDRAALRAHRARQQREAAADAN